MKKQENRILDLAKATKEGWGTEVDKPMVYSDYSNTKKFAIGRAYYAKLNVLPETNTNIEEIVVVYISKINKKTIEYSIVYDGITEYNTHTPNPKHYYMVNKVRNAKTIKSNLVDVAELNNRYEPGACEAFVEKTTGMMVLPLRAFQRESWMDWLN